MVGIWLRVRGTQQPFLGLHNQSNGGQVFLCRRFIIARMSSMRKAAKLLLEPVSPRDIQPPVSNIEKANPHQNSFFLTTGLAP